MPQDIALNNENTTVVDPKQDANIFGDYFARCAERKLETVYGSVGPNDIKITSTISVNGTFYMLPIEKSEILQTVKQLRDNVSPGCDKISAKAGFRFLRNVPELSHLIKEQIGQRHKIIAQHLFSVCSRKCLRK
ncbi:hypothetical protein HHI36_002258 [Cryptolaemus montrouzieri]|uniref:Uncharacterized protein n=1 Tax=Cryptolaemus montrouzieri TaxID=559131 RepID=A0ABD2PBE8_9CUCU